MPAKGKKSLPIDEDTHKGIAVMSAVRDRTMSDLIAEAWKLYVRTEEEKENSSSPGSSPPLMKRDNISDQSAKFPRDWTEKERADATLLIDMLRAKDELATVAIAALLEGWKQKHGDALSGRSDKRKRA